MLPLSLPHLAPGVVAVSGGADSVALLRALVGAGCGPLTVAHLNHGLRGDAADADEAFVRELAVSLGVGFRAKRVNLASLGGNLEATARRVRYAWFAAVAAEAGAGWIATGHTADDQAETVLHRLIRGTGLQGLRGIGRAGGVSPPVMLQRDEAFTGGLTPPARLLRPLLAVTRVEVLDYLASLNQPYRTDATNADPRFTRNRIRAELLPLLRTFNPDVVAALGRLADQAGDAFAVLEADARRLLEAAELPRAGNTVVLTADVLLAAHPYLIREAARLVWQREGWPTADLTADHWARVLAVVEGDPPAADFPGGSAVRRVGQVVQLKRQV